MSGARADNGVNEETPLLPSAPPPDSRPTPLPKLQLSIIFLMQLSEPICSYCIYPFINQLITEFEINDGDEKKTGYYAGVIISLFFLAEAITVFQWGSLSDSVGRKPVLLIGLFGACISMLCFGSSRTFWGLVLSRCLSGMLNGNNGIMKSMMGEVTDASNRAQGFAMLPMAWCIGITIAPFLGGTLSRPHDRFPRYFTWEFWERYPYFLPCAASAAFVAAIFVVTLCFLKETLPATQTERVRTCGEAELAVVEQPPEYAGPTPLRQLLVYPVIMSVANYGALAFLDLAMVSINPLLYATPLEHGGLGLSPVVIGRMLSVWGFICGVSQALFFARVVNRWGEKRVFSIGMFCALPVFGLYPVISILARHWGLSPIVWIALVCQLIFYLIFDCSYGCMFMFLTTATPNKHCLGSTHGLAQTVGALARAFGPAISTSLFAFSVERNVLGGHAVYFVFFLLSCGFFWFATQLPEGGWTGEALRRRDVEGNANECM